MTDIRYFAYGANMDPKIMGSHSPEARVLGPGRVEGYRVEFNVFSERWNGGAANLEPDPNGYVWGVVWELSEEDARNLDTYVGHPTYYAREEVPVELGDEVVSCLTYRVRAQHGYVRPTDEYLNRLRSAVRVQGLPPEALDIIERAARPPERPHIRT